MNRNVYAQAGVLRQSATRYLEIAFGVDTLQANDVTPYAYVAPADPTISIAQAWAYLSIYTTLRFAQVNHIALQTFTGDFNDPAARSITITPEGVDADGNPVVIEISGENSFAPYRSSFALTLRLDSSVCGIRLRTSGPVGQSFTLMLPSTLIFKNGL